jgi:plasmid stabilization system protein ParE
MRVVFTRRARANLDERIAYSVEHFGVPITNRTFDRLDRYLSDVLARHPNIGRPLIQFDASETWVPRTPFIVIYRVNPAANELTILAVYHHAQDRSKFTPIDT